MSRSSAISRAPNIVMTVPHRTQGSSPRSAQAGGGHPLSHHAIMALAKPFSRRGYTVDLAASDRGRGLLAFRPVELPEKPGHRPALRCVMRLERPHRAKIRVVRTLEADDGLTATMTAEGDDPAVLLEVVEKVDPDRQFHVIDAGLIRPPSAEPAEGAADPSGSSPAAPADDPDPSPRGVGRPVPCPLPVRPTGLDGTLVISRSYRAEVWSTDASRRGRWHQKGGLPRLTEAEARIGPVRLSIREPAGRGFDVRLVAEEGYALDIPRDFLAVIGWGWRPLHRCNQDTWLGSVKLPRREPSRTAELETQLDKAVVHIVKTLAAPPDQFHRRHSGARWRAAFQRLLPLLSVCGLMLGLVVAVKYLPKTPLVYMLVLYGSILWIVAINMLDKAYRVEIPPRPRPLTQPGWWMASDGKLSVP